LPVGRGEIHPAINLPVVPAGEAAFVRRKRLVIGEQLVGVDLQINRVISQEAADVDLGQVEIEAVAFHLVQVVATDLGRLRGFTDGDPLAFAGFLETLADGLHGSQLCSFANDGKTDFCPGREKPGRASGFPARPPA
jgi:hypothetical protein